MESIMTIESEMKTIVENEVAGRGIKLPRDRSIGLRPILIGAVAFGAWAFTGFMSPGTLINGLVIHSECVDFAKRKDVFPSGDKVEAVNLRMRGGNFVVDLIAHPAGKTELQSRTCVMNSSSIRIVSMLESGFWR
jgi:hypothetical protein